MLGTKQEVNVEALMIIDNGEETIIKKYHKDIEIHIMPLNTLMFFHKILHFKVHKICYDVERQTVFTVEIIKYFKWHQQEYFQIYVDTLERNGWKKSTIRGGVV